MRPLSNGDMISVAKTLAVGAALLCPTLGLPAAAADLSSPGAVSVSISAEAAAAPTSARDAITVHLDHAKVMRLPARTQTVVVGNPIIADVSVQKDGVVILTGKSYGATNLIALDGTGAMLAESMINVKAAGDRVVVVQRGLERESYSCTPTCEPALVLGDSSKHFATVSAQAGERNALATKR